LKAVIFNSNNFQSFKKVIEELSNQKSPNQAILKYKTVFDLNTIENDLIFIKSIFLCLLQQLKV